jgi:hypothetical protein
MATITIVNKGSGVRVRATSTGGYGSQEGMTDSKGKVQFSDSANRTQIQVWSPNGTRWVNTGDVLSSLYGEHVRHMPF